MDAVENIFGDHYGTSVVSPARILCLCFLFLYVVFQQQKNALEVVELLLKKCCSSSALFCAFLSTTIASGVQRY